MNLLLALHVSVFFMIIIIIIIPFRLLFIIISSATCHFLVYNLSFSVSNLYIIFYLNAMQS